MMNHLINTDAEEQLIGSLMINPTALAMCETMIQPDDFGSLKYQYIYESMMSLWREGLGVDISTISIRLQERGMLDAIGGKTALIGIMNDVATSVHAETYAELVRRLATRRKGLAVADNIKRVLSDLNTDTAEAVAQAHEQWLTVATSATTSRTSTADDAVSNVYETFIRRIDDKQYKSGVLSTISSLDDYIGGFEAGKLYILAGRPGMGKSLIMANQLLFFASSGVPVYIATSEMTAEQLVFRLCAILIGQVKNLKRAITVQLIRRPYLMNKDEQNLVARAMAKIATLPIVIDATPSPTPAMLESAIIKHQRTHNIRIALVDGIYHMRPTTVQNNRIETVASITRDLAQMALRWQIPIYATHQLGRDSEGRVPTLRDLKDTSVVEEVSSGVILIHRDEDIDNGILKLIVAKNRDGETGMFGIGYDAPSMRIFNLADFNIL